MNVTRALILAALLPLLRGQSPPVLTITTTQPDDRVTLTIRNLAPVPLTAYFYKRVGWSVFGDGRKGGEVLEIGYKDAAVGLGDNPIPPNQEATVTIRNGEVTFLAALWADGTSYGDPQSVSRMRERRAAAQLHNDNAIAILHKALDTGEDTPALIRQLQTIVDGITRNTVHMDDTAVLRGYYQPTIRALANPDSNVRDLNGTWVHLTEREIIQLRLDNLRRWQDRLQQYR